MNREIKFRAWDPNQREMEYSKPMPDLSFWKWSAYDSDTVTMQFTGLKDRNSKEIFEGDLIDLGTSGQSRLVGVVVFDVSGELFGAPCFCIKNQEDCYEPFFWKNDITKVWFEIIGNIYEHKHLLEPPQERK